MTSFWITANRFPPILCRMLARRKNGPPLSDDEIATRSGLTALEIRLLSLQTSWDTINLGDMRRFLCGCGMDFHDAAAMARAKDYLRKKPTWKYLRISGRWTSLYEPMLKSFAQSLRQRTR